MFNCYVWSWSCHLAEIVDSLVVHEEGHIRVLQRGVGQQHRVVRLHYRRGHLEGGGIGETVLCLNIYSSVKALKDIFNKEKALRRPSVTPQLSVCTWGDG